MAMKTFLQGIMERISGTKTESYGKEASSGKDGFEWKNASGRMTVPEGIVEIPNRAFDRNLAITSVDVPGSVERIGVRAFADCVNLEKVTFHEGLLEISSRAFLKCGIREIVIPASVRHIEQDAFYKCEQLSQVIILGEDTVVDAGAFSRCGALETIQMPGERGQDEQFHMRGMSFLSVAKAELPPQECGWNEEFLRLAESCAQGGADAMYTMSEYFRKKSASEVDFYSCAANFWRYRAYRKGNAEAKRWFQDWFAAHPGKRLPSILPETLDTSRGCMMCCISGEVLNRLGFLFFEGNREYYLSGLDSDNVVQVFSYCDEDGPDETGFGAEVYYDWWYLDDTLSPAPGAKMIHSCSLIDKRSKYMAECFQREHDIAARAARH